MGGGGWRGSVEALAEIFEFHKNLILDRKSVSPRRLRLLSMTSYELFWHCVMAFGVIFFIQQAIRFTRNRGIRIPLRVLGQDTPISLSLKVVFVNKP